MQLVSVERLHRYESLAPEEGPAVSSVSVCAAPLSPGPLSPTSSVDRADRSTILVTLKNVSASYNSNPTGGTKKTGGATKGVTARFPLRDVNITIAKGDRILMYGRTGTGKSTFLRVVRGVLPVSEGQLERNTLQGCFFLPQAPLLLSGSIYENIDLVLGGGSGDLRFEKNCDEILQRDLGLEALAGHGLAKELLSESQAHLVCIARVLVMQPGSVNLLLLDEPDLGSTASYEKAFCALERRHGKDLAIVCVSHDPVLQRKTNTAASKLFNRQLRCVDGRISED